MATTNAQTFTIGGVTHQVEDTTARAGVSALQTALASLQSALDTLMGTEDITDEIDTYNEIKDFLDGFDVNDPDLSSQLTLLNTQVNDLLTTMQTKASATQVNNLQTAVTNLQTALAGKISGIKKHDGTPIAPDENGIVTLPEQTEVDLDDYYDKDEVDDLIDDKLTEVTIHSWPAGRISMAIVGNKLVIDGVVPSVSLSPSSLALTAESGQQATGTIHVQGSNLDVDVTLALSGASYMSFEASSVVTSKTIAKATAEAGVDVTIYYTGTASDSGTITASSTGATSATASVSGSVVQRLNVGETILDDTHGLTYTVLTGKTTVSVKATSNSTSGNIEIPAAVQDGNGVSYDVVSIPYNGFNGAGITSISLPDTLTEIGAQAFFGCSSLTSVDLGDGLVSMGGVVFQNTQITSIVLPDSYTTPLDNNSPFQGASHLTTIQLGKTTAFNPNPLKGTLKNAGSTNSDSVLNSITTIICYAVSAPDLWEVPHSSGTITLYVPAGSKSSYEGKSPWSTLSVVELS